MPGQNTRRIMTFTSSHIYYSWIPSQELLRDRLKAGEPCPVCGSLEHPAPCALSEDKTITREELEKLEKDSKDSLDKMTRCSSECGIFQRDIFNGYENIKMSFQEFLKICQQAVNMKRRLNIMRVKKN